MLMALFQNKESLSSNKTTRLCGQADKNVQLQARPRGLIGVRRKFNLLLHPIVIRRLTTNIMQKTGKQKSFFISIPFFVSNILKISVTLCRFYYAVYCLISQKQYP